MTAPAIESFVPETITGLPEAARRYFRHAIAPGIPIASHVRLDTEFRMRFRPGAPPRHLVGHEHLDARSFDWTARLWSCGCPVRVRDRYVDRRGEGRVTVLGGIPLARGSGPDVSRSARGRLAIESIWLPPVLLPRAGTSWDSAADGHPCALRRIDGETFRLRLHVDDDGRLREVRMERWGNVETAGWQPIPYGVTVEEEATFDGYTIPTLLRGGWWHGTDRVSPDDAAVFRVRLARFAP